MKLRTIFLRVYLLIYLLKYNFYTALGSNREAAPAYPATPQTWCRLPGFSCYLCCITAGGRQRRRWPSPVRHRLSARAPGKVVWKNRSILFQNWLRINPFKFPNCCSSKGPAPYWSNPPLLIFDIRALWRSVLSARAPECQKLKKWWVRPVWQSIKL